MANNIAFLVRIWLTQAAPARKSNPYGRKLERKLLN